MEDKASRWAEHSNPFYEDVLGGLALPDDLQIAEVEAGGGETLAMIVQAKLQQSGSPGHHGHGFAMHQQKRQRGCSTSRNQS